MLTPVRPSSSPLRVLTQIGSIVLAFAEPVAQAVWCDDIEDVPGTIVPALDVDVRKLFLQSPRFELGQQGFQMRDMKRAPVLRRIAAVFSEPNFNRVAREHRGLVR